MSYSAAERGETAVVLLHAFPLTSRMWRSQVEQLAATGYHVITPELLTPSAPAQNMDALARTLARLLDEIGIERAVLCGLSMGNYVALSFYRQFSDRAQALVLADTRAGVDSEEAKEGRRELTAGVCAEGTPMLADAMMPKLLSPASLAGRSELVGEVRGMIEQVTPEAAAAALVGMAGHNDHISLLAQITCPTLVIVGEADAVTPRAEAEGMHERIAGSRLVVIEGAGHLSNLERPAEFSRPLLDLLTGL